MRFRIRKTLPEHMPTKWYKPLMLDGYSFADGTWIKHIWIGPVWFTLSQLEGGIIQ